MSTTRAKDGNRTVLWLLHSPLHRLIGGRICELEYAGRVTGTRHRMPVEYVRDDDRLLVLAARAATKHWWRNFVGLGGPLTVTLGHASHEAFAVALGAGESGYAEALAGYRRHRGDPAGEDHRIVVIRLLN